MSWAPAMDGTKSPLATPRSPRSAAMPAGPITCFRKPARYWTSAAKTAKRSVAARILYIPLDDLGAVTLKGEEPVHITTTCTVFVESELISFMAQGKKTED